ncbi:LysM peptidoglycan-binding domain-containing protein [Winogradskyella eckloniae]|uniref:LysM peptidoglycan-binding domain-containing protein n=1 Tax=Winogradskyella eckloniae TaxID=1089306 RepID=UPI001565053A|nr:LysM peptidoglycan-binding domain-containing protein [Winogradskyella eckloniae]NRD20299.1 LysM peptidoglycan-binding domain-containing protein [Winogradskyella eckloniae]
MQRNYRLIISIFTLGLSSISAMAQDSIVASAVEYKDVFLDGKPAKLNVATGEVKLVEVVAKTVENTAQHNSTSSEQILSQTEGQQEMVNSDYYSVKAGETLLDVSKKFNVSLTQLKEANHLETTLIDQGQRLRVYNLDQVSEPNYSNTETTTYSDYYIVERGNTLFSLARRFNLSVNELKQMNNLSSNVIIVGQRLRITTPEATYHTNDATYYIVKNGDNLYRIALNNGTTVSELKRLNGLTSNLIIVGQELKLR